MIGKSEHLYNYKRLETKEAVPCNTLNRKLRNVLVHGNKTKTKDKTVKKLNIFYDMVIEKFNRKVLKLFKLLI